MEFVERNEGYIEEEYYEDEEVLLLPPRTVTELVKTDLEAAAESLEELQRDIDDSTHAHEIRRQKQEIKTLWDTSIRAGDGAFKNHMDAYLKRNKELKALRDGDKIEENFELDYGKVAYTGVCQLANLTQACVFISTGLWPIALVTTPLFGLVNYFWLKND